MAESFAQREWCVAKDSATGPVDSQRESDEDGISGRLFDESAACEFMIESE